jgi:hypothetical protein
VNSGVLVLRRRCGWEACDSGLLLWRRNFRPLLFFPCVSILALAAALRFFSDAPLSVAYLVLWWLKPLWDRLILHVVSVRFFEPEASLRRLVPGLRRTLPRGLPGDLLWRRFSPWRAARLAVRVLETPPAKNAKQNSRRVYRQRISSLAGGGLGFCGFLTIFCSGLEYIILGGETVFCFIMWQMFGPPLSMQFVLETIELFEPVFLAMYAVNLALLEGLYVCMGFGLYIRSRVELEGWDIQLLLRKAASSAAAGAAKNSAFRILIAAVVLCLFFTTEAFPQDRNLPGETAAPMEKLEEVFASPEFGHWRETRGIRLKQDTEHQETRDESIDFSKLETWGKPVRELLARILRFVLIAALVVFAVFAVYRLARMKKDRAAGKTGKFYGGASAFSEDPRELLRGARKLYGQGNIREAWALCFHSARAAYGTSKGLVFPPGATQYECLSLVRKAGGDISEGFTRLVRDWVYYAYAGRLPAEGAFEQALDFCHSLLGEEKDGA